MTEGQRDYLADLAGRKNVRLDNTDNRSAAWASAQIEELKLLPDVDFPTVSVDTDARIDKRIAQTIREVSKWTFQES